MEGSITAFSFAVINEKGGTGKSTSAANLGAALALSGKNVLLVDIDPQASLTLSLGFREDYPITINDVFSRRIQMEKQLVSDAGILHHEEGMDVLPSCSRLAHTAAQIGEVIGRESILRRHLEPLKEKYDYIIVDCPPTLNHLTINAMTAANSIIIPVEADYLSIQGLQRHLFTIRDVQEQLNPSLTVAGVLITKLDPRSNFTREMAHRIHTEIGSSVPVFPVAIPKSVKAVEASAVGRSILAYAPTNAVSEAYRKVAEQILRQERQRSRKPRNQIR